MKLGAVFPTCEIGTDPTVVRDFAQTAEELGYARIISYDHVLGAVHEGREPPLMGPYTENDPFHEPFVLYGYLAAVTQRIELMTGVLILPQRQTALVAKQAAELDLLSGGRLVLGLGTGWNFVEYESLGERYQDRGRRLDEQIALLRRLWGEPVVDFEGTFHRVDRAGILPLPDRKIPIWLGGFTPPALRRAARIGDGFLFGASNPPMRGLWERLRDDLEQQGRDPAGFGVDALIGYGAGPDTWREEVAAWEAAGASCVSMRAMSTGAALTGDVDPGFTKPQQHIDALETFMREVAG